MTYERRDPDDPDSSGEPTASDIDAAFAQIIARWDESAYRDDTTHDGRDNRDGRDSRDSRDSRDADADRQLDDSEPTEEIPAAADFAGLLEPVDDDDDHFVPPEPPPLPRPQPATVGAVLLFALGIMLLATPGTVGVSEQYGLPLGLLSITGAIVWLVARLRQGPPTDTGWDDGAQL